MLRLIEFVALVLFVVCTALLLVIRGTRFVVVFAIELLFVVAAVAGTIAYVLGEIGVL